MSTRVERFVELWNEGRVAEALGETADGYTYWDSVMGGPHDRDAHVAMMQSILDAMPDRHIDVHRVWTTGDADFVDYTWSATTPEGSTRTHECFGVLEYDDAGRPTRQRHFMR
jgi:hypothetical protein